MSLFGSNMSCETGLASETLLRQVLLLEMLHASGCNSLEDMTDMLSDRNPFLADYP